MFALGERLDLLLQSVASLLEFGEGEVPSIEIGRLVQVALKDLDPVAYLRFASVYQELGSPEALLELVRSVATRSER